MQRVRDTVIEDRFHTGEAQEYFFCTARRGVSIILSADVGLQARIYFWQFVGEIRNDPFGRARSFAFHAPRWIDESMLAPDLLDLQKQRFI
jgi:hypothetical protein